MKTVIYRTLVPQSCECDTDVMLHVDTDIYTTGFLPATLTTSSCTFDGCRNIHNYIFEYDETDGNYVDSSYNVLSADIQGFICDQTLLAYIDYKTAP